MRKERYLLNNNIVCESHLCANIKYTSYSFPDELSVFIYPIWTRIDASVSSGRHDDEKDLHSATFDASIDGRGLYGRHIRCSSKLN